MIPKSTGGKGKFKMGVPNRKRKFDQFSEGHVPSGKSSPGNVYKRGNSTGLSVGMAEMNMALLQTSTVPEVRMEEE